MALPWIMSSAPLPSGMSTAQAIIILRRQGFRVTRHEDDGSVTLTLPLTRGRRPAWTTARPRVETVEVSR